MILMDLDVFVKQMTKFTADFTRFPFVEQIIHWFWGLEQIILWLWGRSSVSLPASLPARSARPRARPPSTSVSGVPTFRSSCHRNSFDKPFNIDFVLCFIYSNDPPFFYNSLFIIHRSSFHSYYIFILIFWIIWMLRILLALGAKS